MPRPNRFWENHEQRIVGALKYLGLFTVAFVVGFLALQGGLESPISIDAYSPDGRTYDPAGTWGNEEQLVLIYIGSATCAYSTDERTRAIVRDAKRTLENRYRPLETTFLTIGVATDWSINQGVQHLEWIGQFDQISVGSNWANNTALRYVWDKFRGSPGTPQVILVRRSLRVPQVTEERGIFRRKQANVLFRAVGLNELRRWRRNSFAFPTMSK